MQITTKLYISNFNNKVSYVNKTTYARLIFNDFLYFCTRLYLNKLRICWIALNINQLPWDQVSKLDAHCYIIHIHITMLPIIHEPTYS